MKQEELSNRVRLTAEDGMYLYDGENVCKKVVAPLGVDLSGWQEIGQEEGDKIKAEQEAEQEAEREAQTKSLRARKEDKRVQR